MADWNQPATTQQYVDHFAAIRDKDTSLVKMLDGTSDTNLPTGAKRKNSGQKYRLEEWDGTSWNMKEPGLGDLTQAEVDVLDGLTASTSELNKLDGLTASTTELNQLSTMGSTTVSGTQWGYLGELGSAPLEDNNLAANGGTVLQNNQNATISATWDFNATGDTVIDLAGDSFIGYAIHSYRNSSGEHCMLNMYAARGTEASPSALQTGDVICLVAPRPHNGTGFQYSSSNSLIARSDGGSGVGWTIGNVSQMGDRTFNAEELYDNGNRVYSASNAPASTALSDGTALLAPGSSTDPALAFDTWRTPNASRATFVTVRSRTVTDGSTQGLVTFRVDESGGTTSDYTGVVSYAQPEGSTAAGRGTVSFLVPPGGSYEIRNNDDPGSQNTIETHREFTL